MRESYKHGTGCYSVAMNVFDGLRTSLIAILFLLSGCTALTTPGYMGKSDYEKAVILYENGDLQGARSMAQAIKKDDANYRASLRLLADIESFRLQFSRRHMEMAEDYEKAGIYQKAIAEYNAALVYNPSNTLIQNRLVSLNEALRSGKSYYMEREKSRVFKDKKQARKEEKEDPEFIANYHYMKGKIYLESKVYAKAIDEFSAVLRYVPAYMNTQELLAKAKLERDKAADLHLKQGISYFQAEEMELAIKEWDTVLDLDPYNRTAIDYKNRAEVIIERLKKIREKQSASGRPL